MARTNKYASLNFNDIYEKNTTKNQNPPSVASPDNKTKTILSNSRIHGNMLVLTKPSPPPPQHHPQSPPVRSTGFEPDSISLRPLGRTGSGPTIPITSPVQVKERGLPLSPKPEKFVPPHLRPGFLGREEKPLRLGGNRQGPVESPNRVGEEERPKSGSGYGRIKRAGESDRFEMRRPGSSGSRPSSSGL
ncbi:hypothetical protein LguiB_002301 [Lonicera macranthoides]